MEIVLIRGDKRPWGIDGHLYINRKRICDTVEHPRFHLPQGTYEIINHKFEINPHTMRFIVHLSGDRYCPMHMAHMDDKGGNAVKMKWFGKDTNLHTVWDTKLIESQGYSYTEYAAMIQREYKDIRRRVEQMSDEQLLVESYHVTEAIYQYQQIWDGNTYHYIYTWRQPMEKQLYIAGIRLAQLLNNIYK